MLFPLWHLTVEKVNPQLTACHCEMALFEPFLMFAFGNDRSGMAFVYELKITSGMGNRSFADGSGFAACMYANTCMGRVDTMPAGRTTVFRFRMCS
jgi:hypothetical protein